jgi:peptidoglycan/LPS O-acetylase OafA/YrhL
MLRIIAGVIIGWIVMTVGVMAVLFITAAALGGLEKALQPDSYWTTNTFNVIVLIGGSVAAIVGGIVCRLIARNSKAVFALAVIVLAFGIGSAVKNMNKPDPPARTGPVTWQDMAAHGKEPNWFSFTAPLLAAIGLVIGSSLVSRRQSAPPRP